MLALLALAIAWAVWVDRVPTDVRERVQANLAR